MVTNYLIFCLSKVVLISPSLLKDSFPGKEFLIDAFFFEHLENIFLLFLTSKIFYEKSANNLIGDPLNMMSHFFLSAFKIIFLYLSFNSLILMCLGVGLFEFNPFSCRVVLIYDS